MLHGVPHFDQWLGVWAIREEDFRAGHQWFMGLDLHLHLQTTAAEVRQAAMDPVALDVKGGVATIRLEGTLMKQRASMSRSTSTLQARRQIRSAVNNPDVGSILLSIESPGGTAAGTLELAQDVAEAAKKKPVYAFIEDLGASAAYWVASQATKIFANPTAIVGSIGTYGVVHDLSAMAAKEGVKVHVIRAGEMKGAGTPGTEITAEQLAEQQRIVNELNEFFIKGVAAGRHLSLDEARALADGRVYVGHAAIGQRLIDGVQTSDQTFRVALQAAKRSTRMSVDVAAESSVTTAEQTTPVAPASSGNAAASPATTSAAARPATYHELKAALPTADAAFIVSQQECNATVAQAQAAYMSHLAKQNTELQQKLNEQTVAAAATAVVKAPGVKSVPAAASSSASAQADEGDAVATFEAAVSEEMKLSGKPKHVAHAAVCRKQPELRTAMVAAHNAKYAQARRSA
jgi:signal peptide peptidase SppA